MDEPKILRNIHLPQYPTAAGAVSHGGSIPVVVPHGVKSLPPWGTAAGEHLWRQGRMARRQAPAVVPRGGNAIFIFFKKSFLKHF
jgi:hypothetical protein